MESSPRAMIMEGAPLVAIMTVVATMISAEIIVTSLTSGVRDVGLVRALALPRVVVLDLDLAPRVVVAATVLARARVIDDKLAKNAMWCSLLRALFVHRPVSPKLTNHP